MLCGRMVKERYSTGYNYSILNNLFLLIETVNDFFFNILLILFSHFNRFLNQVWNSLAITLHIYIRITILKLETWRHTGQYTSLVLHVGCKGGLTIGMSWTQHLIVSLCPDSLHRYSYFQPFLYLARLKYLQAALILLIAA